MAAIELFNTPLYNDADLISYWRMEGNSNDSKDSNNGTDTTITYNASYGKFGQGASFGGASKINIGDTGLDATRFSISLWVYLPGNITSCQFYAKYSNVGGSHGVGFGISDTNQNYLKFWINGINLESQAALSTSTWYHIVAVYDGTKQYLYVNGTLNSPGNSQNDSTDPTYGSTDAYLGVLWYDGNFTQYFTGYLDDVAFFDRVLTSTEISNLYTGNWGNVYRRRLLGVGL
jgi:hypothetical protein